MRNRQMLARGNQRDLLPGLKSKTHLSRSNAHDGAKNSQNIHLYGLLEHWSTPNK